jgi:hypothetical protein
MADSSNTDKPSKPCKYSILKKLSEGADTFSTTMELQPIDEIAYGIAGSGGERV